MKNKYINSTIYRFHIIFQFNINLLRINAKEKYQNIINIKNKRK